MRRNNFYANLYCLDVPVVCIGGNTSIQVLQIQVCGRFVQNGQSNIQHMQISTQYPVKNAAYLMNHFTHLNTVGPILVGKNKIQF